MERFFFPFLPHYKKDSSRFHTVSRCACVTALKTNQIEMIYDVLSNNGNLLTLNKEINRYFKKRSRHLNINKSSAFFSWDIDMQSDWREKDHYVEGQRKYHPFEASMLHFTSASLPTKTYWQNEISLVSSELTNACSWLWLFFLLLHLF